MNIKGNKVKYLTFNIFENLDFITHCFSTRIGGVSTGVHESLNLGFSNGDSRENVLKNYELLGNEVGFNYKDVVLSAQVHNDKIYRVTESDRGNGITKKNILTDSDGLTTNEKDLVLTTFYADCVPLFFVDKKNKAISISHSGWKGTVLQIGIKTIKKMKELYNSDYEDILVGIGPSICGECFEVDEPVYLEFKKVFDFSDEFITYEKEINKYYISMQDIIKRNLIENGIPEKNIELPEICTKCNPQFFYSHRNMGAKRGSLAGFMKIN